MKLRNGFLVAGLGLSAVSKLLQLQNSPMWGNVLVFPAAAFLVLAAFLSASSYRRWLASASKRKDALALSAYACAAVMSFQLMSMMVFGYKAMWGIVVALPFLLFARLFIYKLLLLRKQNF